MRLSEDYLAAWLIVPERFGRFADLSAANDNTAEVAPGETGIEGLPQVTLLSFY